MYSFFKRILLFTFFIIITLQITSLSTFAMEDDYINNNSHIKKNNLENNEQSQLLNKQKQKHIFTCLSDCLEGCSCKNNCGIWVLNIGIYAYNMFAGVCGSDGCYCCKTVRPEQPCCSISEYLLRNCCEDRSSHRSDKEYNNLLSERHWAKYNPCCCKIICCPLDTACHLSCLPVQVCNCLCECCCDCLCEAKGYGDICCGCNFDSLPPEYVATY